MSSAEEEARMRIARLQAEVEAREGQPSYRPLLTSADARHFDAYAASLREHLDLPRDEVERAAREAARNEEAAALRIPCEEHDADAHLMCRPGTRAVAQIVACENRRVHARARAEAARIAAEGEDRAALAVRLLESGVPERHCEVVLTGAWEDCKPLDDARRFYSSTDAAVLLAGDPDTGKSGAVVWLLSQPPRLHRHAEAFRRFHDSPRVLWVGAAELAEIDAWQERGEKRPRILWSDLREVPRLAIDDIGRVAAIGTDATLLRRFTALLGDRLERNRDTYMTTNIGTRAELAKKMEPQVWDRMQAWCAIFESKEAKFRKRDKDAREVRRAERRRGT